MHHPLRRQESWPFSPGWAANIPRIRSWTSRACNTFVPISINASADLTFRQALVPAMPHALDSSAMPSSSTSSSVIEELLRRPAADVASAPFTMENLVHLVWFCPYNFTIFSKVSLLGVDSLWGDCTFIPADWGSLVVDLCYFVLFEDFSL